jgi:hypothetical protein
LAPPHSTNLLTRDISVYRLATPARGAFSVRHLLRQGVQTQTKMIDHQNGTDQNDADNHHQDIGVTRSGDEAWQVIGGRLG